MGQSPFWTYYRLTSPQHANGRFTTACCTSNFKGRIFLASASPFRGLSPNSTTFPASNRNNQLAYPYRPSYMAMTLASASPYLRHRRLAPLPFQRPTFFDEIPANDRLRPTRKRPCRSVHTGPSASVFKRIWARRTLSLPPPADRFVADLAFLGRQSDDVLLVHGSPFRSPSTRKKIWHYTSIFFRVMPS